jgi:hypothetical protein
VIILFIRPLRSLYLLQLVWKIRYPHMPHMQIPMHHMIMHMQSIFSHQLHLFPETHFPLNLTTKISPKSASAHGFLRHKYNKTTWRRVTSTWTYLNTGLATTTSWQKTRNKRRILQKRWTLCYQKPMRL